MLIEAQHPGGAHRDDGQVFGGSRPPEQYGRWAGRSALLYDRRQSRQVSFSHIFLPLRSSLAIQISRPVMLPFSCVHPAMARWPLASGTMARATFSDER